MDLPSLTFMAGGADIKAIQEAEIIYLNEIPRYFSDFNIIVQYQ